jgi:hypothetical protein
LSSLELLLLDARILYKWQPMVTIRLDSACRVPGPHAKPESFLLLLLLLLLWALEAVVLLAWPPTSLSLLLPPSGLVGGGPPLLLLLVPSVLLGVGPPLLLSPALLLLLPPFVLVGGGASLLLPFTMLLLLSMLLVPAWRVPQGCPCQGAQTFTAACSSTATLCSNGSRSTGVMDPPCSLSSRSAAANSSRLGDRPGRKRKAAQGS